jgi:hypothetical protein
VGIHLHIPTVIPYASLPAAGGMKSASSVVKHAVTCGHIETTVSPVSVRKGRECIMHVWGLLGDSGL